MLGTVLGCVVTPQFADSSIGAALHLDGVVDAALLVSTIAEPSEARKAVLSAAHLKPARSIIATAALNRSMVLPLSAFASNVVSMTELKAVLHELQECFVSTPPSPTTTAADVLCSVTQCIRNREVTASNLLSRATFATHIDKLVKEQLRARRRLLGVPVLLVVDSVSRISLINLQTHEVVALLHADVWSCLQWTLYRPDLLCGGGVPVNCVLGNTVATYRGDRQYRIVHKTCSGGMVSA